MRTLYFDCFAGASGNMILGALIDAGADENALVDELNKLNLPKFDLGVESVDRSGVASRHVRISIPDEPRHRHLTDIEKIIDGSTLSHKVKKRSKNIFLRLAGAEAKVHGIDIENVHFHEVGALDAILDIVGCCIGFELLGIENFICSKINVGSGFVEMEHGTFPVPPPAVTELLKGVPIYSSGTEGEMITPTGAAIIATLSDGYGLMPEMTSELVGYGAGTREYTSFPNVLRIMIGETAAEDFVSNNSTEDLILLETNIDDATPQAVAFALERALEIGANDSWVTPIQMKKNRPGFLISILCEPELKPRMLEMLYSETTTIGVRISKTKRDSLERELVKVETRFGTIAVKLAKRNGSVVNAMPEYEDVRAAALGHNVSFSTVRDAAVDALNRLAAAAGK